MLHLCTQALLLALYFSALYPTTRTQSLLLTVTESATQL